MRAAFETYDAPDIQAQTRLNVQRLAYGVAAAFFATLFIVFLHQSGVISSAVVAWALFGTWFLTVWCLSWRLQSLRRTVWCVKISPDQIIGYDYARRMTTLNWNDVMRVNMTDAHITVTQSPYCYFEIPVVFPAYSHLAHRLVACAEDNGTDVYLDGRPWSAINIYKSFPFLLSDDSPSDPPHATLS